jgi:hypothetical protein
VGAIELDRRSYLSLTRARFTIAGSEPRPAFRRLGTVRPELKALLRQTPEGTAGLRTYRRLLAYGYILAALSGLIIGVAAGSLFVLEILRAMEPHEMTRFLTSLRRYLEALPEMLLFALSIPLFALAFILDFQAFRSILKTIDSASVSAPEVAP